MLRGRFALGLLAVLLIAILGPYVASDKEARSLDATTRKALGGSYVALPDGVTHYELTGPADGPVVVLIHGGTIPFFAWDAQVPALRKAGFRILRMVRPRLLSTGDRHTSKWLLSGIGR
jgi:hypothetical protein